MSLQEYKCPRCGGTVEFDSGLQKMKCQFCESVYTVDELEGEKEAQGAPERDDINWNIDAGGSWESGETEALRSYVCNSCGGEIISDATTAASSCPFCGNPVVMNAQFTGTLRPDLIIPFKKSKDDAKMAYKGHIKNKRLLPSTFKDENHIDEIKGVYVPFWLFDAAAEGSVSYKATATSTWQDRSYNYTKTSIFQVQRIGRALFAALPVDGSKKMPDVLMESIEPYNVSEVVDFKTAYLSGYLADRYDVDASQSVDRANTRVKKSVEEMFKGTVSGYDSVQTEHSFVRVNNGTAKYALYPVWLLNTTYQGNRYTFAMNGQTGKFVGDLPIDKKRYKKICALIMAASTLGSYAIAWLVHILMYFI